MHVARDAPGLARNYGDLVVVDDVRGVREAMIGDRLDTTGHPGDRQVTEEFKTRLICCLFVCKSVWYVVCLFVSLFGMLSVCIVDCLYNCRYV